jgi:bacterioferritin
MKGHKRVLEALNDILTAELTGVNQYFLHGKMCRNWGYERLAEASHKQSIGEMKHASDLVERILFLEGIPNLQRLGKVRVGESVPEQLRVDHAREVEAIGRLNTAIALCADLGDNGSRELLQDILQSEEEHLDWLETQLGLVKQLGDKPYLAEQLRK